MYGPFVLGVVFLNNACNFFAAVYEDHVKRYIGILHGKRMFSFIFKDEKHTALFCQRLSVHEPQPSGFLCF